LISALLNFTFSISVVTVPVFTPSVSFGRFFSGKTAVTVLDFDKWLSLPLKEVPGMGDWCGNKGGLLAGSQREEVTLTIPRQREV